MSERLEQSVQRLEFETVQSHDVLKITTGIGDEAWRYTYDVKDTSGKWPAGNLSAISPEGKVTPDFSFQLHGCGQWTTRRQNPVQQQERAFTPYYDGLIKGNFMWGVFAGEAGRFSFDKPGQEISEIVHVPYRENLVLQALASDVGPFSVKQLVECTSSDVLKLQDKEVRTTLTKLIALKRVTLLKKNVQLFEISKSFLMSE